MIMKKYSLLALTLSVVLLCSWDRTCLVENKYDFHFEGVVLDALGNPIPDVTIEFFKTGWTSGEILNSTYTDTNGQYALSYTLKECACYENLLFLDAEKFGYTNMPERNMSSFELSCTTDLQKVDFELIKY